MPWFGYATHLGDKISEGLLDVFKPIVAHRINIDVSYLLKQKKKKKIEVVPRQETNTQTAPLHILSKSTGIARTTCPTHNYSIRGKAQATERLE